MESKNMIVVVASITEDVVDLTLTMMTNVVRTDTMKTVVKIGIIEMTRGSTMTNGLGQ